MADPSFQISDSTIREIEAHARARDQERRENDLVERIANYIVGPVPVRIAAAKEIISAVRESLEVR